MKNILLVTFLFVNYMNAELITKEQLLEESYNETQSSKIENFKTKDFELNFEKYGLWINKNEEEDSNGHLFLNTQSLKVYFILNNNKTLLFQEDVFKPYGQNVIILVCKQSSFKTILFIQSQFGDSSNIYPWFISFNPHIYEINKGVIINNSEIVNKYFYGMEYIKRKIIDDSEYSQNFYPYYNEQRIIARLYETGTCDKELTQKANIEVLIEDKWIPQEQSWNIKDEISNNANSSIQNPSLTQNQLLENVKSNQKVFIENINEVLKAQELTTKTLQKYNDIAYYLQQANANEEAIFLLEKIIEKFPNRTVAYLNLADAYNGINENEKAKENYEKYINLMKQDNRESKIPKRVLEYK
jgi:tetratricopeptide (TPR) repeat protein